VRLLPTTPLRKSLICLNEKKRVEDHFRHGHYSMLTFEAWTTMASFNMSACLVADELNPI
jgi:hypothetical protein